MKNRIFLFVYLLMFLVGMFALPQPLAAQDDELIISAIEIRGNEVIPDREILAVMQGRAGDVFSLNTLSADLAAIESLGWFAAEPEHVLEPFESGVKIIIILIENPEFTGVSINQVGPKIYSPGEVALLFKLDEDQLINNNKVSDGLQSIERKYREDGYTAATITDIRIDDDGIVRIEVNEGVISEIVIEGNTKTHTHIIARELTTQTGDVFNAVTFRRDLERVYNLQLFEDIQPTFELDENREVVLFITVTEARTGQFGFGGGYSSNDGFLVTLSYAESNFRGLGQRLSALAQFGGPNPDLNVSFFNPVIDNRGTSFTIEGFWLNESDRIRDPDDPDIVTRFELERRGGSVGVVRPMSDDVTLSLSLKFFDGIVTFLDDEGNPLPPEDIPQLTDNEWITGGLVDGVSNSLTTRLARDTRDFSLDPSRGMLLSGQTTMIGQILGGDFDAFKHQFEMRHYVPLNRLPDDVSDLSPTRYRGQHVFAFRVLYGTSSGHLPLIERFKVGGQDSVRGASETAQSGDQAFLFNTEYRFPLGGNLGGALFFDTGTAALPGDTLDLTNMVSSIGIGIRYRISFFGIAPLRLDYGYDLEEEEGRIVFGFGHLF